MFIYLFVSQKFFPSCLIFERWLHVLILCLAVTLFVLFGYKVRYFRRASKSTSRQKNIYVELVRFCALSVASTSFPFWIFFCVCQDQPSCLDGRLIFIFESSCLKCSFDCYFVFKDTTLSDSSNGYGFFLQKKNLIGRVIAPNTELDFDCYFVFHVLCKVLFLFG